MKSPASALERFREEALHHVNQPCVAHADETAAFREDFARQHGFRLDFAPETIAAIASRAQREGRSIPAMCSQLFKDYPFGLKLVSRSTGVTEFRIPAEAIDHPDPWLSELVVQACRPEPQAG